MVKKTIAMIVLGMFLIVPFQVQAEESEKESGGLLSKTSKQLFGTTEKLVKSVQTTVNDVEKVIPVINPVTDVVSEVGKTTLPVVEDVVTSVTDTTDTVLTEVVEGVDKTVKILPKAPVVTPILTETTKTLGEVVSEVQTVVNSSEETVKSVVDIVVEVEEEKVRNPIEETPKFPATVEKSNEQVIVETPPKATTIERIPNDQPIEDLKQEITNLPFEKDDLLPIIETTTPINVPVIIEPMREETSLTEVVAEDNVRVREQDLEIYLNSLEVVDLEIAQDNRLTFKTEANQNKDVNLPFNPSIPLGPDPQMIITSGVTWNGQGNPFASSGSFLSTGNDILLGFLPADEMLKELTKKKWYHKNSYAIIQWIHTPLRKPPELTPFLYVI